MTNPSVSTDYTPEQLEDMRRVAVADRMRDALGEYARWMQVAVDASLRPDVWADAHLFRADARAALHMHPALLDILEGKR